MSFLSDIGSVFSKVTSFIKPIASDLLTGGVGQLAKDIFSQLSKSLFQDSKTGPLFSNSLSIFGLKLPNPLQGLNGLLSGADNAISGFANSPLGDILKHLLGVGSTTTQLAGGGGTVTRPGLAGLLPVMGRQATSGPLATAVQASTGGSSGGSGSITSFGGPSDAVSQAASAGAFSDAPSADEQKMLDQIKDPAEKARMQLQLKLQKQAEIASMISNILNIKHQTAMSTIQNIR